MWTVEDFCEKINTSLPTGINLNLRLNEPMAEHSSFRVGGPADIWLSPRGEGLLDYIPHFLDLARQSGLPLLFMGRGANVVVADRGIRGIVFDTSGLDFLSYTDAPNGPRVCVGAGLDIDTLVQDSILKGYSGLEFLAGMPGSIGGALWMNARCYGSSISDVLIQTQIVDEHLKIIDLPYIEKEFGYKKSPFQQSKNLILAASFQLKNEDVAILQKKAQANRQDREEKGHYKKPCAGSVFKNNYAFGKPTGKIIDELGLRGLELGGAQVAPWHGNIIINNGNARAQDIRELAQLVAQRVLAARGLKLECEILFLGEWT